MVNSKNWEKYEKRLVRVLVYIHDHLDDELDLQKLAEIACMSPYHWHRIYAAVYGESIVAAVKRMRLHRAAGYLANTQMSIRDIAEKSGYKNLQSFTRIFKSEYGMPPAQYRSSGSHTHFKLKSQEVLKVMYHVAIKSIPAINVVGVPHLGSYMQIEKSFGLLYAKLGSRNLITPGLRMLGIYYDDPSFIAEDKLHSHACVVLDHAKATALELDSIVINAGRYAVLEYKGPYADMRAAYKWLYSDWLVNSGEEIGATPVFEEYMNNPRETAPADLHTDIYLPLQSNH